MTDLPPAPLPLVSVLMPAYNADQFLAQAVESVLGQTYANWELLLMNDGSTDRTREVALSFADPRIRLIDNEANLGLTPTLNRGIGLARGTYLARLDADDVAYPQRLAVQVAYLEQHPAVGMCGAWADQIDAQGQVTGEIKVVVAPADIQATMLFHNCFYHSTVMLRTELARQEYDLRFPIQEDYEFWVRLARQVQLAVVPQKLVQYRVHGGNVTITKRQSAQAHTEKIILGQLADLGLVPTEQEKRVHQQIGHFELEATEAFLATAGAWLARLKQANDRAGRFANPAFDQLLGRKWASVAAHATPLGRACLRALASSPLTPLLPAGGARKLRWLARLHTWPLNMLLLPFYRWLKTR
jgi:hypothetical protein